MLEVRSQEQNTQHKMLIQSRVYAKDRVSGATHKQLWRPCSREVALYIDVVFKIEGTDSLLLLKLMNLAVGQLEVVDSFVYALEFVDDAPLCGRSRSMMKTRNEMGVFVFGIITVI